MNRTEAPVYRVQILPALRAIQEEHGFLDHAPLAQLSKESGIPLHRLQEVGSFFPHFRFDRPPKCKVRVCRDMACHLAGAGKILEELGARAGGDLAVEGASCLGRCDRAPAACVVVAGAAGSHVGGESELYYHGRSAADLAEIAAQCLKGRPPPPDRDADRPTPAGDWVIDLYEGRLSEYLALKKVVAARDASLARASDLLQRDQGWSRERAEQFRLTAQRRGHVDFDPDDDILGAVRAWQTETAWANGPELGGWADAVLAELDAAHADLRGLGGAGWPANLKWRDVRSAVRTARARRADDRAFVVVNGDESEPGTFKDREILLRSPHLVLEGLLIAGLVGEATQGFIFIRHEYPEQIAACDAEIRRAEALGICGTEARVLGRPFPVSVFVSPGGYILGEQSALIEAMSDRRGEPRNVPPRLETNGLDDQPTLVNNVETLAWVPYITFRGGQAYAGLGVNGWRGKRLFSVSGDVKRPGVYEIPMGLTMRELLLGASYCQGISGDRPLKGIAPSGPSGGFLPPKLAAGSGLPPNHDSLPVWKELARRRGFDPAAREVDILDLEIDLSVFRALSPTGAVGAGVIVYAEGRDMAEQAVNALEFYRNESCGKCVPCRIGAQKIVTLGRSVLEGRVDGARWTGELLPLVNELMEAITMTSICGLGRSIPMPVRTLVDYFGEDLARHLARAAHAREGGR
jgi:NADH:ubiquinone oxidoreductase subunit F (NADH-binding)/NADH:ubiquinone oxidoreductase subunit E